MDAKKYFETKNRMTKGCKIACRECPLFQQRGTFCLDFHHQHIEEVIAIVEKWGKDNPVETYLSYAKKYFPNMNIGEVCIKSLFGMHRKCGESDGCLDCWNQEYKEVKSNDQ